MKILNLIAAGFFSLMTLTGFAALIWLMSFFLTGGLFYGLFALLILLGVYAAIKVFQSVKHHGFLKFITAVHASPELDEEDEPIK